MKRENEILLLILSLAEVALGINPKTSRTVWAAENLPIWIGAPLAIMVDQKFPLRLSTKKALLYGAMFLMWGGFYSYAKVPAGNWAKKKFNLKRNHYDRVGHFLQGFVPALMMSDVFSKGTKLKNSKLKIPVAISSSVSISALYEIIEFLAVKISKKNSKDFLATQTDPWEDAIMDMIMALGGAIIASGVVEPLIEHNEKAKSLYEKIKVHFNP